MRFKYVKHVFVWSDNNFGAWYYQRPFSNTEGARCYPCTIWDKWPYIGHRGWHIICILLVYVLNNLHLESIMILYIHLVCTTLELNSFHKQSGIQEWKECFAIVIDRIVHFVDNIDIHVVPKKHFFDIFWQFWSVRFRITRNIEEMLEFTKTCKRINGLLWLTSSGVS